MGMINSPLDRRCGEEEDTSAHILCEYEALVKLRHIYFGSFFLDPEDVRRLGLGAIWNYIQGRGLLWLWHQFKGHNGTVKKD